jgi:hypothetical protein
MEQALRERITDLEARVERLQNSLTTLLDLDVDLQTVTTDE